MTLQLYEDAAELQMLFMKQRDELCKNGEILLTPALSYTDKHLQVALEAEKQEKLPREQREDDEKRKQEADGKTDAEKTVSLYTWYTNRTLCLYSIKQTQRKQGV